ncbi:MAG: electron transfer flavoprotein subunit beta/FixA family protein [Anaerolineales bacterium]|nr:MAG: electron transfer flavoprotein subunit beta/FixA family protein [Anaerolineales bacterium]
MSSARTYNSVVLVKQVPDTHNITGNVMKNDGTLNRSALPAIFNPEDLNALEMALQVRERYGGQVTVMTMGPPQAAEVLRDALHRGADRVILLSDRKFAGADTLATSYALTGAIKKLGDYDLVFCGRQAIDGDTAQVGPQTAEKLGIPQITYAESIVSLDGDEIVAERALPLGKELVQCSLPCLLTVVASANQPRPPSARKRIEYKLAATPLEYRSLLKKWPEFENEDVLDAYLTKRDLKLPLWTTADLDVDEEKLGLSGSPTQVYKVNFVVLESTQSKEIPANQEGIAALLQELVQEYIVG